MSPVDWAGPVTGMSFALGSYEKFQPGFPEKSRHCKTMPSGALEFTPLVHPGYKCSYGKISSRLTEISGTEPARPPLILNASKMLQRIQG